MTFPYFAAARLLSLCAVAACVSDFSPDPHNAPLQEETRPDASRKDASIKDAAVRDARPPDDEPASEDEPAPEDDEPVPEEDAVERGPCDLSGRWLMTERGFTSAVGATQVSLGWFYVELRQQGDTITFAKSLLCGGSATGLGFEVSMDDSQAWPAYQQRTNYDGRTGSSRPSANGCDVRFDEGALVRGMTTTRYRDRSAALPVLEDEATATEAGWEDWDDDGHPGITMYVTGSAQGQIYTSFRTFATASGEIEARATTFQLEHDWSQERSVLSYQPPTAFILASPAERNPKPGANFVELTRLRDDQAGGDDDAKCQAVRELAPSLTPNANKIQ